MVLGWAVAAVGLVLLDLLQLRLIAFRDRVSLAAEVLVLRKQLAMLRERQGRQRLRLGLLHRCSLATLSRLCSWREAIVVVQPATVVRWHRAGVRLFWRWTCRRGGRPSLPHEIRALIAEMARNNPTWGEERIAAELRLKLGLRVSPRTVRKYWTWGPASRRAGRRDQRWMSFVRNHARAIVACDFLTVVSAAFRTLYVFVVIEVGTRRIIHTNVTTNPTVDWTTQQLREAIPSDHRWRFLIHDRQSIFSEELDAVVRHMRLHPLKTPVRAPQANAFCERLIGTIRRECLDWLIPLGVCHLRKVLDEWVSHYNRARPHMSLGPGIPDPPEGIPICLQPHRHRLPSGARVASRPVLAGLHHEYRLSRAA